MKLHNSSISLTTLILFSLFVVVKSSAAINSPNNINLKFILSDTSNDVKVPAEFPGGQKGWAKYIEKNIDYDLPVRNGAPVGKYQVFVSFKIDKDGSIIDVLTENDFGYGMSEEVIRVMKNSPKWTPASINGVKVIYRQRYSVIFSVYQN